MTVGLSERDVEQFLGEKGMERPKKILRLKGEVKRSKKVNFLLAT